MDGRPGNDDDGPMTIDVSLETGQVIEPHHQNQPMSMGSAAGQGHPQGAPTNQGYSDLQVGVKIILMALYSQGTKICPSLRLGVPTCSIQ